MARCLDFQTLCLLHMDTQPLSLTLSEHPAPEPELTIANPTTQPLLRKSTRSSSTKRSQSASASPTPAPQNDMDEEPQAKRPKSVSPSPSPTPGPDPDSDKQLGPTPGSTQLTNGNLIIGPGTPEIQTTPAPVGTQDLSPPTATIELQSQNPLLITTTSSKDQDSQEPIAPTSTNTAPEPQDQELLQLHNIRPCFIQLVRVEAKYPLLSVQPLLIIGNLNDHSGSSSPNSSFEAKWDPDTETEMDSVSSSSVDDRDFVPKNKKHRKSFKKSEAENYGNGLIIAPASGPQITEQMEALVRTAYKEPPATKLIDKFGILITAELLVLFESEEWLEDDNIDFYLGLIRERNNGPGALGSLPKVYTYPCWFYPMLNRNGYQSIQSITDQTNIFDFDILFVPISLRDHWRLLVINFENKSIISYDSLSRKNQVVFEKLKAYLKAEYEKLLETHRSLGTPMPSRIQRLLLGADAESGTKDKSFHDLPTGSGENSDSSDSGYTETLATAPPAPEQPTFFKDWLIQQANIHDVPQQANENDCGVFLCQFAESLSRRVPTPFDFTQQNMSYFRLLMAYETMTGQLMERIPKPAALPAPEAEPSPMSTEPTEPVSGATLPSHD